MEQMRGDAFIHFVCGSRRVSIRLGVLLLIPKSPHYLQKPISGLGRIVLPLKFFYGRTFSLRSPFIDKPFQQSLAHPFVRFFRVQTRRRSSQGVVLNLVVASALRKYAKMAF